MTVQKTRMTRVVNSIKRVLHPMTISSQITDLVDATDQIITSYRIARPVPPNFFYRPSLFTSSKTSITIPKGTQFKVHNTIYKVNADTNVSLGSFVSVANRKGRDVYLYAVESGTSPVFVISMNSTYPSGYNAYTSRKLGGFHCLCEDVGTISDHPLSGYNAGDILPTSRWDLWHRPNCNPEGMVYCEGIDKWVDIYLPSVAGSTLVSQFGGTIADGASEPKFHWYKFAYWFAKAGKRLLTQPEFMAIAVGSNSQTNIMGKADPGTTGGHVDTENRRMISWIGCEDCCGVMWQWGAEAGGPHTGTSWANAWDENSDPEMRGMHYAAPSRGAFGGRYALRTYAVGIPATIWMNLISPTEHDSGRGICDPKRVAKNCS